MVPTYSFFFHLLNYFCVIQIRLFYKEIKHTSFWSKHRTKYLSPHAQKLCKRSGKSKLGMAWIKFENLKREKNNFEYWKYDHSRWGSPEVPHPRVCAPCLGGFTQAWLMTQRPHGLLMKNTSWPKCSDLLGWWPTVFTWSTDQSDYYGSWVWFEALQVQQSGKLGERSEKAARVMNKGLGNWVFMRK